MQLWKGRFKKELSKTTNDFNSSISFDSRMYKEDIEGSIAHATMLGRCGIIKQDPCWKQGCGSRYCPALPWSGPRTLPPAA